MVWRTLSSDAQQAEGLVWDLRQIYAKELVGETLKAIKFARMTENYPAWYHLLKRDLYAEINQKLKPKERDQINDLINYTKSVLVKYSQAYTKRSRNEQEHEAVEDSLLKLEKLMREYMEAHGMFGTFEDDEGQL